MDLSQLSDEELMALRERAVGGAPRRSAPAVDLSAKVFEDLPVTSGKMRRFREANQSQANMRIAEQFGEAAELLTPDVLSAAKSKVGAEFDKYVKAKTPISVDSRFMASMRDMKRQVELLPKEMRSPDLQRVVKVLYDDIEPAWRRGDVKIDGARYKAIREELTDSARTLYKEGGQKTAGPHR